MSLDTPPKSQPPPKNSEYSTGFYFLTNILYTGIKNTFLFYLGSCVEVYYDKQGSKWEILKMQWLVESLHGFYMDNVCFLLLLNDGSILTAVWKPALITKITKPWTLHLSSSSKTSVGRKSLHILNVQDMPDSISKQFKGK